MAPIKSSLARSVSKLLGVFKDTDLSLRGNVQSTRHIIPAKLELTGGTTVEYGGSRYHIFRTSTPSPTRFITIDTLSDNTPENVIDFLVVAGGGGSGGGDNAYGGGGGAGGLVYRPAKPVSSTGGPYTVSIGSGGAGLTIDNSNPGSIGATGGDTTIGSSPDPIYFIAKGGGGGAVAGGHSFSTVGGAGGSGGGGGGGAAGAKDAGATTQPTQPGDSGTYGHGSAGNPNGGGGGGAGGTGSPNNHGGNGYTVPDSFLPPAVPAPMASEISPITTPSPQFRIFAGGGGRGPGGDAGTGGGGEGFNADPVSSAPAASQGTDGRGGGGGSGTSNNPVAYAGDGGDGIVIVRYDYTA